MKGSFTKFIRDEETLLRLRKIVCFIITEKKESYNKTTEEGEVLVDHYTKTFWLHLLCAKYLNMKFTFVMYVLKVEVRMS